MAIVVKVKGKHLLVTEGLREHAEQKLQRLEKYFSNIHNATVIESIEGGNEHRVEVTLEGDGVLLRGEERTSDMYASLDRVVDKLEQRVKKFKDKHTHRRNHQDSLRTTLAPHNGAGLDGILDAGTEEEVDTTPRVIRTKAVTMKPMDLEDACQMLELTDHDWYVYLDSNTNMTQVVYRRRDGNYGLVVPKI